MTTETEAPVVPEPAEGGPALRRQALAQSGWGSPVRLFQPSNPCFQVFVVLLAWGAVQMVKQWGNLGLGPATTTVSVFSMTVFGLVLAALFLRIARYGEYSRKLLLAAFIWGGVAATFGLAINANTAISGIIGKLFGQPFVTDWWAALSAPLVEETAKAAGFLLLFGLASGRLRSLRSALVLGAFLGLGFEILEDLLYTFNAALGASGPSQLTAAVETILVRGATGFFSHALYTAVFCAGVIYLIGTRFLRRDVARGVILMLAAVLLHGIWDGADAITDGIGSTLLMLADGIAGILILVWLLRISAPQEREWTRDVLAPEVEGGTISAAELDALAGTPKERRKYVRAPDGTRVRKGRHRRRRRLKQGNRLVAEIARSGSAAGGEAAEPGSGRARRRLAKL